MCVCKRFSALSSGHRGLTMVKKKENATVRALMSSFHSAIKRTACVLGIPALVKLQRLSVLLDAL